MLEDKRWILKTTVKIWQGQTPADIEHIVLTAISVFKDSELAKQLQPYLITPQLQTRQWDYSLRDKQDELLPCWIIAVIGDTDIALAYSEYGHGVYGHPWGLVFYSGENFGANDAWYRGLEAAILDSGYFD